jgi:two-component system, OmpR family, response regulator
MARRIALVEDDATIRQNYVDALTRAGYEVTAFGDRGSASRTLAARLPELAIIDIGLGADIDGGFALCRDLRAASARLPIIFLSARDSDFDIVAGLRLGADDYVTKPFGFDELVARVEAVLRRAQSRPASDLLRFGDVSVDFGRLRATRAGAPLDLSPREFAILACLTARRGEAVTREQLLQEVWGYESLPVTRTVDMHIAKLRRKIEPFANAPEYIVTIHGTGYRFVG